MIDRKYLENYFLKQLYQLINIQQKKNIILLNNKHIKILIFNKKIGNMNLNYRIIKDFYKIIIKYVHK